jgi:hypothetical protein
LGFGFASAAFSTGLAPRFSAGDKLFGTIIIIINILRKSLTTGVTNSWEQFPVNQVSQILDLLVHEENSLHCFHGATFYSRRMMTNSLEQSLSSMAQKLDYQRDELVGAISGEQVSLLMNA